MSSRRRPRLPRRADQPETREETRAEGTPSHDPAAAGGDGLDQRETRGQGSAVSRPDIGRPVRRTAPPESRSGRPDAPVRVNNPDKVRVESVDQDDAFPEDAFPDDAPSGPRPAPVDRTREEQAKDRPQDRGSGGATVVDFTHRKQDAERRERKVRAKRRRSRATRWGLGVLALVVAAALFCALVFYSPLLSTESIKVEGANISDGSEISRKLEPLQGKPLTRISEGEVKDLIGSSIVIQDVSIEARPPHQLVVTLHERVPVVTVKEGDKYVLVDKDGVAVGSAKSVQDAKVPLLDGGLNAVKQGSFHDVVAVVQTLPQSLLQQMSSAKADSSTNIKLQMNDGSTVLWGTSDDSEYKAQVLSALVKALGDEGGVSTYDVSSPDHPVTT